MLNKYCRRHRTLVQNVETDSDQVFAIALGEVSHRPDESGFGLTQFRPSLGRRVLTDDGAVLGTARFLKSTQRTECAGVIDRSHQYMPRVRGTQMSPHRF